MNKQLETELKHRSKGQDGTQPLWGEDLTLEDLLNTLARHGKVALFYRGEGWSCDIELFVTNEVKGAKFEVHSGYKHPTAHKAAIVCLERMSSALAHRYD